MKKKSVVLKRISGSREISLVIVLLVLCAFVQFRNHTFLTAGTIEEMLKNYSTTMIMSIGMLGVLLVGGIDISIGATVAFSGMSVGLLMRDGIVTNVLLLFVIGMLIGCTCGIIVGLVISKGEVLPIIATLGFMNVYRGLTYIIADSQWVSAYQVDKNLKSFAQSRFLGFGVVNNLIMIVIICYVLFFVIYKWTRLGRKVYAVGSNREAALVSGFNVERIHLIVYSTMGTLAGLAGGIWVSLYASAQGNMAMGVEMDVIASCVIGGVSLTGGRGSVTGVFLGSLVIAIVGKALPLIGVGQFAQNMIKGLIILAAVIINVIARRGFDKANLKGREV